LMMRCSFPWTNTSVGNIPEPVPEDGPMMVWKDMFVPAGSLGSQKE
jgi:hypothetical protein